MDVVIAAGGKGTRIKKLIGNIPKPLFKIKKKITFLDYLLNHICKFNIDNVYILAGYKGEMIYKKFHGKVINLVNIHCIVEKKPLGTGGCLSLVKNKISDKFIFMNGDSILNIDLNDFIKSSIRKDIFLALCKNSSYKSNKQLSNLSLKNNKVVFDRESSFMSAGIITLNKKIITTIKKKFTSLEYIMQSLILKKKIYGKIYNDSFLDIGTRKNLISSKKLISSWFDKDAIFFDRDGTLNYDSGYTYKIKDFKFYPKTKEVLKKLSKKFNLFIVTNQAGIAKNFFKIQDFYKLHKFIKKDLSKSKIYFSDVQFCPYHEHAKLKKYKKKTNLRKPGNRMLKNILLRWNINIKNSYMIGDSIKDYKCAKSLKLKFYYAKTGIHSIMYKIM